MFYYQNENRPPTALREKKRCPPGRDKRQWSGLRTRSPHWPYSWWAVHKCRKRHEQTRSKVRSLNKRKRSAQPELNALRSSTFLAADQTKDLATKTKVRKRSVQTIHVARQIKHACGATGYELLRALSYSPCLQTGLWFEECRTFVFCLAYLQRCWKF